MTITEVRSETGHKRIDLAAIDQSNGLREVERDMAEPSVRDLGRIGLVVGDEDRGDAGPPKDVEVAWRSCSRTSSGPRTT